LKKSLAEKLLRIFDRFLRRIALPRKCVDIRTGA